MSLNINCDFFEVEGRRCGCGKWNGWGFGMSTWGALSDKGIPTWGSLERLHLPELLRLGLPHFRTEGSMAVTQRYEGWVETGISVWYSICQTQDKVEREKRGRSKDKFLLSYIFKFIFILWYLITSWNIQISAIDLFLFDSIRPLPPLD